MANDTANQNKQATPANNVDVDKEKNSVGAVSLKAVMAKASETIKLVANKFQENPMYSMFVRFRINDLIIDSTNPGIFKNLVMSLTNKKNGSGNANSFNLQIQFSPQLGENYNIDTIDKSILEIVRGNKPFTSLYCELQYGYGDETDTHFRTPVYKGILTDYSCDIRDASLVYTFEGYSGMAALKEFKKPLSINAGPTGKIRPTEAVRKLVETYMQGEDKDGDALENVKYDIKFDKDVEGSDMEVPIPSNVDKNPAKAITDILAKAINEEEYIELQHKNVSIANKIVYTWHLSDAAEGDFDGVIYVTMNDPTQTSKADADLVFNWMSPGSGDQLNHIVYSFQPQFKGNVLLSLACIKNKTTEDATSSYFVSDEGKISSAPHTASGASIIGGSEEHIMINTEGEKSTWVQDVQYPYKATLVTVGMPCEIPITGLIKVVPMIYGQPHMSQGVYQVMGITDIIDSSGFKTTWDLLKTEVSGLIGKSNTERFGLGENVSSTDSTDEGPVNNEKTAAERLKEGNGPVSLTFTPKTNKLIFPSIGGVN